MNKRWTFVLLFVLPLAACGASEVTDVEAEPTATEAATEEDAATESATGETTCESLVDEYMVSVAAVMTTLGGAGFDELFDSDPPLSWTEAGDTWSAAVQELAEQSDTAGCSPEVVEQLICDRQPDLEPAGDAALHFLSESLPCGVEGTVGKEEADAYLARLHERSDQEDES